ncbi:tRNA (guanosine(46)-N7)-methyltransferase TrmB [Loigolactobacillus backii]|uniref:tRNA (guanine-N(7)-)-methyltransferase n=1 Tax=Loigolactobacillus backii TaxID=375175 RepID=A0A192H372_9LACO|nr:tRNA (guanosine(46)-N7)-methyltransferase TrmB [Loigolactobacillus backii]ANK59290.1 tRNA (guanosine(46)-N7)-methyltransferase TrmB [Loigolactobacillus backii]ANK62703.1 tRNA (guanosine(46)-N7)-methyltransferase TrmB [Loigolactobacillus backii]ANK64282.1 tRNA (guanosine(46)-N7)-methyltransferase TrmB [Loigolactobacillus backii]ANK67324.1 tRNA (guanosine(46)-N7)-methyltransferase TrmB [Loigolactobacillus backii]ANK70289.1 tRNA (guanosine(46)-N7)-methyltransferase TrmB [Loigolactobacillus bac
MRLRNKPRAVGEIADNPQSITTIPADFKGKWQTKFAETQPLNVEIGSGKGRFIIEMAKAYPKQNFIGIELQPSVAIMILEKQLLEKLPNLYLIQANGENLTDYFATDEVANLYLNFSDPWPKKRHAKRRLTHKIFLAMYEQVLQPEGKVTFKTDNRGLFEFSLMSFNAYGAQFEQLSLDLHNSPEITDNIETEYEQRFSQMGHPIYLAKIQFAGAK